MSRETEQTLSARLGCSAQGKPTVGLLTVARSAKGRAPTIPLMPMKNGTMTRQLTFSGPWTLDLAIVADYRRIPPTGSEPDASALRAQVGARHPPSAGSTMTFVGHEGRLPYRAALAGSDDQGTLLVLDWRHRSVLVHFDMSDQVLPKPGVTVIAPALTGRRDLGQPDAEVERFWLSTAPCPALRRHLAVTIFRFKNRGPCAAANTLSMNFRG
jgi:hypothetical protein